jgi:Zn-dependent peptidase ImmA (M78 family)
MADRAVPRPSPNLLDTIYLCQQRQAWYRDHARLQALDPVDFVGSARVADRAEAVAEGIRGRLGFNLEARRACATWEDALRQFITLSDDAGVMVMCSGVVANNNHRRLDPQEFRGFALADALAPVIFVNGADTKSAQMFTLAHELAHLWLGQSALSDADVAVTSAVATERWCNAVAAELLLPMDALRTVLRRDEPIDAAKTRFARHFKVSTLVVLRRLFDAGQMSQERYWELYRQELDRLLALQRKGDGGNFYLSQAARVSKRFARALMVSTLEGVTLYRDAMRMVGVSRVETFHELGRSLGMPV